MIRSITAVLIASVLLAVEARVDAVDERAFALGTALIRSGRAPGSIGVSCAAESCNVIDVVERPSCAQPRAPRRPRSDRLAAWQHVDHH